ncbi:MAG: SPOR domain-containing protein, partial [Ignavibacteriales bacterium]|nr:SPOR domain-containing protein [Ignavibacteriales bacterium]
GSYIKAKNYCDLLQKDYPNSPYIGFIGNIPNANETEILPNNNTQGNNNYKYSVQAGAFLSSSNAETLKQKFQNDGYYSDITEKVIGGSILNVVRVGRFVTRQEAEQFLAIIESKYQIKGSIISY